MNQADAMALNPRLLICVWVEEYVHERIWEHAMALFRPYGTIWRYNRSVTDWEQLLFKR